VLLLTPGPEPSWSLLIWLGYWWSPSFFLLPPLACIPCLVLARTRRRRAVLAAAILAPAVASSALLFWMTSNDWTEPRPVIRLLDLVALGSVAAGVTLALARCASDAHRAFRRLVRRT